jgi:hypothetical protein
MDEESITRLRAAITVPPLRSSGRRCGINDLARAYLPQPTAI